MDPTAIALVVLMLVVGLVLFFWRVGRVSRPSLPRQTQVNAGVDQSRIHDALFGPTYGAQYVAIQDLFLHSSPVYFAEILRSLALMVNGEVASLAITLSGAFTDPGREECEQIVTRWAVGLKCSRAIKEAASGHLSKLDPQQSLRAGELLRLLQYSTELAKYQREEARTLEAALLGKTREAM